MKMTFDIDLSNIHNVTRLINRDICILSDNMQNRIFSDIDFSIINSVVPFWMVHTGHSQESAMSKSVFEKLVKNNRNYLSYKLLYYYDCDSLLFALQNRFTCVDSLIEEVYKLLSKHIDVELKDLKVARVTDEKSIYTHACMNTLFINLASSCDLMTKVAYELASMPNINFTSYPKLKSSNITYGKKCMLPKRLQRNDTYFAVSRPLPISKTETLRDELVHNGSLDINYSVYSAIGNDGTIYEWLLFPDFDNFGNFESYKGRKKFYGNGDLTFNEVLPQLVEGMLVLALNTLKMLNTEYQTDRYTNKDDFIKYKDEITNWIDSYEKTININNETI